MSALPKTQAEIAAFNEGVKIVLDLAARTAASIKSRITRPMHEAFAVAALEELAESGVGLLIRPEVIQKVAA